MAEVLLFEDSDVDTSVDVLLDGDTVWLTQQQMADLFKVDRTNISRHLGNIYRDGELERSATCADFAQVRSEGARSVSRTVPHFNLDAIISVGYRVDSKRGVRFRQWATRRLNEVMTRGFTVNARRLAEAQTAELRQAMEIMTRTLGRQADLSDESRQILDLVSRYARTWSTLLQFDEDRLEVPEGTPARRSFGCDTARADIGVLKQELLAKGEASDLFGRERDEALEAILGGIDQTMFGEPLYKSAEEKAANLFYFVIKDHPFSDGNKRIGSFLFLRYLHEQGLLVSIAPDTLTALALLVAESEPADKELMVRLAQNCILENHEPKSDFDHEDNGPSFQPGM